MDELTIIVLQAVLNGISLSVGIYIGSRFTGKVMSKEINTIIQKSATLKKAEEVLIKIDKILGDEELQRQVVEFFTEAKNLVTSPEAKNFFKNATQILKEFSSENKTQLNLPEKPKKREVK